MSIYELKILLDLNPESKIKILSKYAMKFELGYFFVDSVDGHCYLLDRFGDEKDVSLVHEITEFMISKDIKKIIIPNNVTSIGYSAFRDCSELTDVTILGNLMSIEYRAFWCCGNLANIIMPNSITNIGSYAFAGCSNLANMTMPNSITNIGRYAFYYCNRFTHITIPTNVTYIGCDAFRNCNNLKSLIFKNRTIYQVKLLENYPFGIKYESIIKAELN